MPHRPPHIRDLDGPTAARARVVVLHDPRPAGQGQTAWSLSLTDLNGHVLAREHLAVPDCPLPLGALAKPYLDLIGHTLDGPWLTDDDASGRTRHRALIA